MAVVSDPFVDPHRYFISVVWLYIWNYHSQNEDMAPRISAGDLVLYYRLNKQPLAGDIIICNKNGKQYVDRVIAKRRRFGRNYRGRNGKK